jgi:4'-phosphopantetheinyl transferase
MNIFWLQQTEANVPAEKDWLAPAELLRIEGMRFLKRRRDYLLGRWTAKCALAAYLDWPTYADVLSDIDVGTAPSGAPTVMIRGERAQLVVSISHCSGQAICSVAHSGIALGCDLELVEPRSDAFLRDYFTAEEQEIVEAAPEPDRAWLVTLFWSAKESALKALQEGLRLDTRSVVVRC